MKKLVIVTSALDVGGAQRFCMNFCRYLNNKNYNYQIVFLRNGKSKELKKEFEKYNINFKELGGKSVLKSIPKLIKHLRQEKPDIILSTIGNVDFATSIAKLFIPNSRLILRKANVIFENQKNIITKLQLLFENKMANRIVALTEEMKEDYSKYGFKKDKINVINNMVDLDYIKSKIIQEENHPWFQNKKEYIIIANARMVEEKRYDILIKMFTELRKKRNDVRLMILGSGKLFENIKSMIPNEIKNDIEFLGFKNNPYYFMKNSDIFVLTSDYEGFPNVIIEAFACGLPVVSTDCKTGPKEIIREEVEGFIVPVQDYKLMAEKINFILNDKDIMEGMRENAINRANDYRINIIAEKYIELFEKV